MVIVLDDRMARVIGYRGENRPPTHTSRGCPILFYFLFSVHRLLHFLPPFWTAVVVESFGHFRSYLNKQEPYIH